MEQTEGLVSAQQGRDNERLLIGITGSISAISMPEFIVRLRNREGFSVQIVMSRSATHFVSQLALQVLSGRSVFVDHFQIGESSGIPHMELTKDIGLFVVIPATANIIGKAALGISDDLISTAIVAARPPILFVPTMNEVMWIKKPVQANVAALRDAGHVVLEPVSGLEAADLKPAKGAMPAAASIIKEIRNLLSLRR